MKFSIARDALFKPLNFAAGVVERRQTLPILANVQLVLAGNKLAITGTDLEVELIGHATLETAAETGGEITVPARKLVDICRSLPDGSDIKMELTEDQRLLVRSGRSRFTLSTLPSNDFPSVEQGSNSQEFTVRQGELKKLLERCSFAMAQQDVRYYLNGMLWEVDSNRLRLVATDGHRLAMCTATPDIDISEAQQVIVPRKGVIELARLLQDSEDEASIAIGSNHIRVVTDQFTFTSKLIDGKFPDYDRVLPRSSNKTLLGDRSELSQAFTRTAILSNEKYRGIRFVADGDTLTLQANNPEQEEAEEVVSVDYSGDALEVGFNVSYLLEVLNVLDGNRVKFSLTDANSSALVESEDTDFDGQYVVMPMRL